MNSTQQQTQQDRKDLQWGAFTPEGPWDLGSSSETIEWSEKAATLRQQYAAEVPSLVKAPKLPPIGRGIIVVATLGKAVASWWVKKKVKRKSGGESKAILAVELRHAFEKLGVTYIKLAQIISAGEGLFGRELTDELKKCRDQVKPESFAVVKATIEHELGTSIDNVFSRFGKTAIASASIAQVHRAKLIDGSEVAVKVQRPGIDKKVRTDLKIMAWIAPHLVGRIPVTALANPPALVELFAETIIEELDFRVEAANMCDVAAAVHNLNQETYIAPRPHPTYVTEKTLVMEYIHGFRFDDRETMVAHDINPADIIRKGMVAFMEGALLEGTFHGDLHSGNLTVLPNGQIALLDFGITARLTKQRRLAFLSLMIGAVTNNSHGQIAALRDLGALPQDVNIADVVRDLRLDEEPIDPTALTEAEMVAEIQRVIKALLGYGANLPKELMLFTKNMLFVESSIATLAPEIDILAEVEHVANSFAEKHSQQLWDDLGVRAATTEVDLQSVKAGLGVDNQQSTLTYEELQKRRETIQNRMRNHHRRERQIRRKKETSAK